MAQELVVRCSALNCRSKSTDKDVKLKKFPKNRSRFEVWCQKAEIDPSHYQKKWFTLCSKHFHPSSFLPGARLVYKSNPIYTTAEYLSVQQHQDSSANVDNSPPPQSFPSSTPSGGQDSHEPTIKQEPSTLAWTNTGGEIRDPLATEYHNTSDSEEYPLATNRHTILSGELRPIETTGGNCKNSTYIAMAQELGVRCSALNCQSKSTDKDVTLKTFPKNRSRFEVWCQKAEIDPSTHQKKWFTLCSKHFHPSSFLPDARLVYKSNPIYTTAEYLSVQQHRDSSANVDNRPPPQSFPSSTPSGGQDSHEPTIKQEPSTLAWTNTGGEIRDPLATEFHNTSDSDEYPLATNRHTILSGELRPIDTVGGNCADFF